MSPLCSRPTAMLKASLLGPQLLPSARRHRVIDGCEIVSEAFRTAYSRQSNGSTVRRV